MAANATELWFEMETKIKQHNAVRQSADPTSPMSEPTAEAPFGSRFVLDAPYFNIVGARTISITWAIASTLHFFAETERAEMLSRYNKHADRFVKDGIWAGAYGLIAMSQIRKCIDLLRASSATRRAIVSLGGFESDPSINRPACISFLHFMQGQKGLDMFVYQRSLNLYGVMPYDCVLLSNILNYVSIRSAMPVGRLVWVVGSLHTIGTYEQKQGHRLRGIYLPIDTLSDPKLCLESLLDPSKLSPEFSSCLETETKS